jgi:RNA polymerase sigma-70 factor, ECF subfamily
MPPRISAINAEGFHFFLIGRVGCRQPTPVYVTAVPRPQWRRREWTGGDSRHEAVSVGAATLPNLVPTPRPPTAAEARLQRLVERIQADDLTAFDDLYRLTRDEAARTLYHLVGRRADLEDLLQETYLKVLKAVKTFRGEAKFKTFLYRICANVALMHLRWWKRRPEDPVGEVPEQVCEDVDPERAAQQREARRLVQLALEKLTAKKRIVFVYHELCGMGPEEIAEVTDTSYNTVRSRLHHARLEFTEAMHALVSRGGADAIP